VFCVFRSMFCLFCSRGFLFSGRYSELIYYYFRKIYLSIEYIYNREIERKMYLPESIIELIFFPEIYREEIEVFWLCIVLFLFYELFLFFPIKFSKNFFLFWGLRIQEYFFHQICLKQKPNEVIKINFWFKLNCSIIYVCLNIILQHILLVYVKVFILKRLNEKLLDWEPNFIGGRKCFKKWVLMHGLSWWGVNAIGPTTMDREQTTKYRKPIERLG